MRPAQCGPEIRCGGVGLEQEGRVVRGEVWRGSLNIWCKTVFWEEGDIILDVLQHVRGAESPCFSWSAPTAVVCCSPGAVRRWLV